MIDRSWRWSFAVLGVAAIQALFAPAVATAEPVDELVAKIGAIFAENPDQQARKAVLEGMRRAGDRDTATGEDLALAGLAAAALEGGNSPTACDYFRRGAEAGYVAAMHMYGECYANGILTANPTENIEKWYGLAATNGNWTSLCALGELRMLGRFLEPDGPRGLAECREAADNGSSSAQLTMADAYMSGTLVSRNHATAAQWYETAFESGGSAKAARSLAILHADGLHEQPTLGRAIEYAEHAARRGDPVGSLLAADLIVREISADEAGFADKLFGGLGFRGYYWARQAFMISPTEEGKQSAERFLRLFRDTVSDDVWRDWGQRAGQTSRSDM
jgi:TPR repeat protein